MFVVCEWCLRELENFRFHSRSMNLLNNGFQRQCGGGLGGRGLRHWDHDDSTSNEEGEVDDEDDVRGRNRSREEEEEEDLDDDDDGADSGGRVAAAAAATCHHQRAKVGKSGGIGSIFSRGLAQ